MRKLFTLLFILAVLFLSAKIVQASAQTPKPTLTPTPVAGFKISGYIVPDFAYPTEAASVVKSGFKVEIAGLQKSALTDNNGYYEITNIPLSSAAYTIRISKSSFLYRTIANVSITKDIQIGSQTEPVDLWAGDLSINSAQDNVINMADIMELSKSFNTTTVDAKYNLNADFNKDDVINMADVMIITKHFNKTIADYPVFSIIVQTPTPTVNSSPSSPVNDITEGGIITVGDNNSPAGEGKENAFDNNVNTKWLIFQSAGWIQYDFTGEDAYTVKTYSIASANDHSERDPKDWTVKGSNDGENWIVVDSRTNEVFTVRFQTKNYSINNNSAYKYYRLELTNNSGTILQLGEIQLFGEKGVPATGISTNTPKPTVTPVPTSTTPSGNITADEQLMLDLVNKARSDAGLKPLAFDIPLEKCAREKARDMVVNNYFDHNSPSYGSPFDMMKTFGITYRSAGENIAMNYSVQSAFDAWMNSDGHRANILNSGYNYIGIGIEKKTSGGVIYVQQFIGK